MRTLIIAFTVWLVGLVSATGEDSVKKNLFSFSISTRMLTKYVDTADFGGSGLVNHDKPVVHSDVVITERHGFYLSIWDSVSLAGRGSENYGNEIDWTLGWSGVVKGLSLDLGIGYFDLWRLMKVPEGDVIFPSLQVGRSLELSDRHTLTPYGKIVLPTSAKGDTLDGGVIAQIGVKHKWDLWQGSTVNQAVALTRDDGPYGLRPGCVGHYSMGVTTPIGKHFALEFPSVKIVQPLGQSGGRATQFVALMGVSFSF